MKNPIVIDGNNLTIEKIVEVSRSNQKASISKSPAVIKKMAASCKVINKVIKEKRVVYGVSRAHKRK